MICNISPRPRGRFNHVVAAKRFEVLLYVIKSMLNSKIEVLVKSGGTQSRYTHLIAHGINQIFK